MKQLGVRSTVDDVLEDIDRSGTQVVIIAEVTEGGSDGMRPDAIDAERAAARWTMSEELVGERFA